MRSLLISDLHLQQQRPDITRAFYHLLDRFSGSIDQLFILGDFFELWLGDDFLPEPAPTVARHLLSVQASGCKIYIMRGNRDFLMGGDFAESCGAILIDDPYTISFGNQRCVLMHGDTLCTDDLDYQAFRNLVRNPEWQEQFLRKPIAERIEFGQQARKQSQTDTAYKPENIMDVTQSEVVSCFEQYQVDVLIHGHTHRPATHTVTTPNGKKTRFVLGDWHNRGWYLLADENEIALRSFKFPS